eukprot:2272614-Alexandrium_andersonii.AAC.1
MARSRRGASGDAQHAPRGPALGLPRPSTHVHTRHGTQHTRTRRQTGTTHTEHLRAHRPRHPRPTADYRREPRRATIQ